MLFHTNQHNGQLPCSFAQKEEFKKQVRSRVRAPDGEANYDEAVRESYRAYVQTNLSSAVRDIIATNAKELLSSNSSKFRCDNEIHVQSHALLPFVSCFSAFIKLLGEVFSDILRI